MAKRPSVVLIDTTTEVLHAALRGLAARQRVTAANISNVETPGYTAQRVSFEDALSAAAASGDPSTVEPTVSASTAPSTPNGNNVSIDDEIVSATETSVRYQLAVDAVNNKFKLLHTSIGTP